MELNAKDREIVSNILRINGTKIGSIDTVTNVDLKGGKSNPYRGRITKHTMGANVIFINDNNDSSYQRMVRKRLVQEGMDAANFSVGPRPWGERIQGTPLIQHKDTMYVQVVHLRKPTNIVYKLDGQIVIDINTVPGFTANKSEGRQGGLVKKVIVRTPKISSIHAVKMGDLSVSPR